MGYNPQGIPSDINESRIPTITNQLGFLEQVQHDIHAILEGKVQPAPQNDICIEQEVWLEGKNLKTGHQNVKLRPRRYGPFKVVEKFDNGSYQFMNAFGDLHKTSLNGWWSSRWRRDGGRDLFALTPVDACKPS